MNAQDQADIDRLNKLLALPPSEWLAAEDEATHLIESLTDTDRLGATHSLVVELDGRFIAAQEAGEDWKKRVSSNPPSPVPQVSTVEIPPADPTLLQDTTPLGVALNTLVRQDRFDLRRRLQAGHYSAGYSALDRKTSAHVVVKLPTNDGNAWASRFKECDDALATEAKILPLASKVIAAAPAGSARPVEHVAAGELSIPQVWRFPVHWLAQRFAQGQRVSEIVPMREAREIDGLHILRQVTTMARHLYAANLAHCDLKEDALFWFSDGKIKQVEVIDWNRATKNPTKDDLQREFEALQRLTNTIFFGLAQAWGTTKNDFANDAHAYASELLVTFSGLPLSRGTRMLLFRSLNVDHPAAITTVDALHSVVMEQCAYWDQPTAEPPVAGEPTPRGISALLDRVAVEVQRPDDASLAPAARLTWLIESYAQARTEAIRHLRIWLSVPEDLRTSFPKLEAAWAWLPDVWPLALLVPLSKLWFSQIAREQDSALIKLANHLINEQLEDAAALARRLANTAPARLAKLLQQTAKSADAYRELDRVGTINPEQRDYATALRSLKQVREIIPFEPRTLQVFRLLDAGDQCNGRTVLLLEELDQIGRLAAKDLSQTQRRLLATLEELRGLGRDDPRYASQQQTVTVLNVAENTLAAARTYANTGVWAEVRTLLVPWHNRSDLRQIAADVYIQIEALFADAEYHLIAQPLSEFFGQVKIALAAGDLVLVQQICAAVRQTFGDNKIIMSQITKLEQALPVLTSAITALQNGDAAKLTRLKPETYPEICYPLVQQINAMTEARRTLTAADTLETLQVALTQAQQIPLDLPPSLLVVLRTLISEAGTRVRELLHKQITSGATLTSEELSRYETALSQVQTAVGSAEPALLTTQVLLAQRREALVIQRQTELTTALDTTSGQISGAIGQVKTDLGTKVSGLEANISTLTSAQQNLAGKGDLKNVGETITKQLDVLARQDRERATAIQEITQYLGSLDTSNQELSNQIADINQHMERLSKSDHLLITKLLAISEKLDVLEKAIKPRRSLLPKWLAQTPKPSQGSEDVVGAGSASSPTLTINGKGQTQRDGNSRNERGRARSSVDGSGKRGKTGFPLVAVGAVGAVVIAIIVLAFSANSLFQSRATSIATVPSPTVVTTVTPKLTETAAAAATTEAQATEQPSVTIAPSSTAPSAETSSPVPSATSSITSTISLSNTQIAQLGETVNLPAKATEVSGTVKLVIGSLTVSLPVTARTGRPASITIPETLLLTNTLDFALPSGATLFVTDQISVPLQIQTSVLTVGKITKEMAETFSFDSKVYAYLWLDPANLAKPVIDAIHVGTTNAGTLGYLGLQKGDKLRLLEGKGAFYRVVVMTNEEDKDKAVGQIGWIRKTLVHGGQ